MEATKYQELQQQQQIAIATTVDNIHVKYLRQKGIFNNLQEWMAGPNNIYVGRAGRVYINKEIYPYRQSKWANPFINKPGKTLTREENLARYEAYVRNMVDKDPEAKKELLNLHGKNLGCWCKPESCHADVLVKLIDELRISLDTV